MLKKTYPKTKKGVCQVTFTVPKQASDQTAYLVGEFNNWDQHATPMKRAAAGKLSVTLNLPAGRDYRFRYLLNETQWENEAQADRHEPNGFGSEDSVICT